MRLLILVLAALAFVDPAARAQSTAPVSRAPIANAAGATAAGADAAGADARPRGPRQTLEQRFQGANRANDGHLTIDQASGARWYYVTRNFDAMDKAHKGYVTVEDIRGYARERRAARQQQQRGGTTSNG